jgi:hypothetical protein
MKDLIILKLYVLTIALSCCQSNTNDKPPSKMKLEEQERQERMKTYQTQKNKAIQIAEVFNSKLLARPKLKNFILDTKRPDIYDPLEHIVTSTSVASLPGQIDIEFARDTTIKIIRFKHVVLLKDKVLELNEFADLIAENYNFQWTAKMDKENPSYAEYTFFRDSTGFFLSGEGREVSYADKTHQKRIKELNKKIKNLWKDGLQGWEMQYKQDYELERYRLTHTIMITYIFEISNRNYNQRKKKEHSIKEYGEELKKIEFEAQKAIEKKSSKLKDF